VNKDASLRIQTPENTPSRHLLGVDRRHAGGGVDVVACGEVIALVEGGECFRIKLLDHPKAAELPFGAVEVAVVVGRAGDEAGAAYMIVGLNALDHMHREGQPGDPRPAVPLVLQIEPG
jgi:hypothetical protein